MSTEVYTHDLTHTAHMQQSIYIHALPREHEVVELRPLLARGEGAGLVEGARVHGGPLREDEEAGLVAVLHEGAQQPARVRVEVWGEGLGGLVWGVCAWGTAG